MAETPTGDGRYACALVYRPPDNFVADPGDQLLVDRPIPMSVAFVPDSGAPTSMYDWELTLIRPPIYAEHGIWSSRYDCFSWDVLSGDDPRFSVYLGDYQDTSAASFDSNWPRLCSDVQKALGQFKERVSCTQVDFVCHSMGCLLGRVWATKPTYATRDNHGEGYFNRMISLNAPHHGSPLANIALEAVQNSSFGSQIKDRLASHGMSVDKGAVADLDPCGAKIQGLAPFDVPTAIMASTGCSDIASGMIPSTSKAGLFFSILRFFGVLADERFPAGTEHDCVVPLESQLAGVPWSGDHASTKPRVFAADPFDDPPQWAMHTTVPDHPENGDWARGMINNISPSDPDYFVPGLAGAGQPPAWCSGALRSPLDKSVLSGSNVADGLSISTPLPGTVVNAGEALSVTITPMNGYEPTRLLFSASGEGSAIVIAEVGPYTSPQTAEIAIPCNATPGPMAISADGFDAAETFSTDEISVTIAEGDLWNLFVDDLTFIATTPPTKLHPRGCYADCMGCCGDVLCDEPGNSAGMTDGVPGLVYTSLNPGVAKVDPLNGLVTPTGLGTTLVTINKAGWDTVAAAINVKGLPLALRFVDDTTLSWPLQALAVGYDAAWGDLGELRTAGLSVASKGFLTCAGTGTSVITSEPGLSPREGHWYLVRTVYSAGPSTFDSWEHWPASRQVTGRDAAIEAAGLDCPTP